MTSRVFATVSRGRASRQAAPALRAQRPIVQPRLRVGPTGDRYEREADRVADRVMRMPAPAVQRACTECEEEAVQAKETPGSTPELDPAAAGEIRALSGGRPLPPAERAFFEPRMGAEFGDVRVHTGPRAETLASGVQARAFTHGRDVVFGRGEYAPGSSRGRELMAHELTHVVQQSGGRQRIQRQVQIDPFPTSTAVGAGFDPDMTTAFLSGLQPGRLRAVVGVTRFALNGTVYDSANTVAQDLGLPLVSERDLRAIPQPNLRDPGLDDVWNNTALVKKGKKKEAVRLVQQALQAWGRGKIVPEDPLPGFGADAFFWDETLAAVEGFQAQWTGPAAPLAVDGLVGPLTLGALEAAMAELNVSEFWLNTAPHNQISGAIQHIRSPATWSVLPMLRSTLVARARLAGQPLGQLARCPRRDNRLNFTARGPANLDQQILAHERIHERDIGIAVRNHILPWYQAVARLVASGQRFRAVDLAAAEALFYAEIGRRTAPTAGDPCSVGQALEVDLVNFEFALHRRPGGLVRFTGFTTNGRRCTRAQANIDNRGVRPRRALALVCHPPPHMTISLRVPA